MCGVTWKDRIKNSRISDSLLMSRKVDPRVNAEMMMIIIYRKPDVPLTDRG